MKQQMQVLDGVLHDGEQQKVCPIRYLHNPLRSATPYIHRTPLPFPSASETSTSQKCSYVSMSPLAGAIPYCSAIPTAYESQFWRESMEASRTFIHLLATDKNVADIEIRGLTLGKIARHELRSGIKHRCLRATAYMYPFCSEPRRLEIIAVLMVMLFLFDDKCEGADDNQVPDLVIDFLQRLENPSASTRTAVGPLQAYLDDVINDIHAADAESGNGGAEVYSEMKKTFTYLRPPEPLSSVDAYLAFRRENVCAGFVFASIKFSLSSSVDMQHPAIQRFMLWAADHLAMTNDLYSYEKEARAYREGSCPDLINIVSILETLMSLPDEGSALEIAFALILQREQWMSEELKMFEAIECLDSETWEFLRAVWACLAGNTFYSMTCVRYGGENARIREGMDAMGPKTGTAKRSEMLGIWPRIVDLERCRDKSLDEIATAEVEERRGPILA